MDLGRVRANSKLSGRPADAKKEQRRKKQGKEERRQQGPLSRPGASERPRHTGAHVAYAGAAISVGLLDQQLGGDRCGALKAGVGIF